MLFRQFHRPHQRGDARTAIPIGAMAGLLLAGLGIAGCAGTPDRPPAIREPAVSPSADGTIDQAWHDAKTVAARGPGRMPAVGTGSSMQPVFGEDTLLVINPIVNMTLLAGAGSAIGTGAPEGQAAALAAMIATAYQAVEGERSAAETVAAARVAPAAGGGAVVESGLSGSDLGGAAVTSTVPAIAAFVALPIRSLDALSLNKKLREIGALEGASKPRPEVA